MADQNDQISTTHNTNESVEAIHVATGEMLHVIDELRTTFELLGSVLFDVVATSTIDKQ